MWKPMDWGVCITIFLRGQVLGCGRRSREFRSSLHKNSYNCHNLSICSMSSSFVSFSFDLVAVIDITCVDGNPNLMYKFVNLPRWLHRMAAKSLNHQIVQDFPMFPISYPIRIPVFFDGNQAAIAYLPLDQGPSFWTWPMSPWYSVSTRRGTLRCQ